LIEEFGEVALLKLNNFFQANYTVVGPRACINFATSGANTRHGRTLKL